MTGSTPNLIAMSLFGPAPALHRAVERIDELVYARIDEAGDGDSILDLLKAAGATREELRDQLVTLLAAGHETTATALAWACERLARHPAPLDTDQQIDAFVREVLRTRPVLSITARRTLQPYTSRATRFRRASTSPPACISRTAATRPCSSRSAAERAAASVPRSPRSRCGKSSER